MENTRLDSSALLELKEMLEDEFDDLISTYIRDADLKMTQLAQKIEAADFPEIRHLAHSLKGASINIGIIKFGELCHQLENAAHSQNPSNFDECYALMKSEYDWVSSELSKI
jgi:HPt (histidine-containing phosphotransfer) domain-containing protein